MKTTKIYAHESEHLTATSYRWVAFLNHNDMRFRLICMFLPNDSYISCEVWTEKGWTCLCTWADVETEEYIKSIMPFDENPEYKKWVRMQYENAFLKVITAFAEDDTSIIALHSYLDENIMDKPEPMSDEERQKMRQSAIKGELEKMSYSS